MHSGIHPATYGSGGLLLNQVKLILMRRLKNKLRRLKNE
jgi:hypothetical protein